MSVKAYIFGGHEGVDKDNIVELDNWTEEAIVEKLCTLYMTYDRNESLDGMFGDGGPTHVRDTVYLLDMNLAQAVECPCDGGMIYIVRCSESNED